MTAAVAAGAAHIFVSALFRFVFHDRLHQPIRTAEALADGATVHGRVETRERKSPLALAS